MLLFALTLFVSPNGDDAVQLNNRGAIHQSQGDLKRAELCYLEALAAAQAASAADESLARIHSNLAVLYKQERRFAFAVRHYRAAAHHREYAFRRERAVTLNNLAEALRENGDPNYLPVFREAARLLQDASFLYNLDRAIILQNYGVALAERRRFSESIQALELSLLLKSTLYPPGDPQIEITRRNLANIQRTLHARRLERNQSGQTVDILELGR